MPDYGVVCCATGAAVDPTELGPELAALLAGLRDFRPFGQFRNDGRGYEATLSVTAPTPAEAETIAVRAVASAVTATDLPDWPIEVRESFELPPG